MSRPGPQQNDSHKFGSINPTPSSSSRQQSRPTDSHQFGSLNPTETQVFRPSGTGTPASQGWDPRPSTTNTNQPHSLSHPSWESKVSGPSDHAINYNGGSAQFGQNPTDPQLQRRHSDTGTYQNQGQPGPGPDNCYNASDNTYHVQPQQFDDGASSGNPWYNDDLPCCCDWDEGGGGGRDPSCSKPVCSIDPNCHTLKMKCASSHLSLDDFPNPFKRAKRRTPAWMTYCGKILRFFAFYQESIPESPVENYRIHQVEIRYFLNDGTMEVFEPATFDPAFPQGIIIRRQKMTMPPPIHGTHYSLEDLDVGCEITFFGKTFYITGVDQPTRRYLNRREGRQVKENIVGPEDVYTNFRLDRHISLFPKRANRLACLDLDKRRKFFTWTGKVLRFWAYWDSRCDYGGSLRKYVFHYYLSDDTVEIREIVDPNGGIRGAVPFLSKGKLLKDHKDLVPIVGIREEALLILNTTSGGDSPYQMTPTFMTDKLCPGAELKEYITDKDLAIGAVINVYGRSFILVSCDKATQTYYREKYGVEDFTPLTLEKSEEPEEYPRMEAPPHIYFGDEIDTLYNWDRLRLAEPPLPLRQQHLAIQILDEDVLCFYAEFYNPLHKVNSARRFVIKVHMIDNTIEIVEKPHPNTGFKQGRFLVRSKVRRNVKGHPPRYEKGEESEYYCPVDYFIGNILDINGFIFLLTGAAEITLSYMEANPSVFPQSNFCLIIEKVREAFGPLEGEYVLQTFSCNDTCLNGVMSMEDFRSIFIALSKESFNEHEIKTLTRAFRVDAPKAPVDFQTLQSVVQTELQRHGFDHYLLARVEYTLRYHDPCRFGHVDKETVRATLKGAKLPLDRILVDFLVDHFSCVDDCCRINYCSLLHFLDWVHNSVPSASPAHISCVLKWLQPTPPTKNVTCVNYRAFLKLINPHFHCDLPSVCCPQPEPCEEYVEEEDQECCQQEDEDSSCYVQYPCPEDENSYCCQRERAGRVISDCGVRSEELRCKDEDCGVVCREGCTVPWRNSDRMSEELLDAYDPCVDQCTNNDMGEGRREILNRCDFIGNEDVYTRPQI